MKFMPKLLRPLSRKTYPAALLLLMLCVSSFAQSGAIPVVTVRATDPVASWSGNPGAFTLFRDGPTFFTPTDIVICADARDPDGYVATVEFFEGTNSLGIRTNCLPCAGPQNPFCLVWTNVQPGDYVLHARATDNGGATALSDPVK